MKKLLTTTALGAAFVLSATSAMALDPLGTPVSNLNKGQWGFGVEHSRGEAEVNRLLPNWNPNMEAKHKFDDIRRTALRVSYGVSENIELFGRVGKAEADSHHFNAAGKEQYSIGGDDDTFWGLGAKIFLCTFEGIKIGVTGQWSTTDYDATGYNDWWGDDGTEKNSIDEVQLAIGGQKEVADGLVLYAGAVAQQINGDNYFQPASDPDNSSNRSALEEDDTLGFYAGGTFRVMDNVSIGGEYQGIGDDHIWGINAILTY